MQRRRSWRCEIFLLCRRILLCTHCLTAYFSPQNWAAPSARPMLSWTWAATAAKIPTPPPSWGNGATAGCWRWRRRSMKRVNLSCKDLCFQGITCCGQLLLSCEKEQVKIFRLDGNLNRSILKTVYAFIFCVCPHKLLSINVVPRGFNRCGTHKNVACSAAVCVKWHLCKIVSKFYLCSTFHI